MGKRAANGQGYIRQRSDGRWECQISTPDGKRRSVYGKSQKEVRMRMVEIQGLIDNSLYLEPTKITVSQWLDQWMQTFVETVRRGYTVDEYRSKIKNHIEPGIGEIRLQKLTGVSIQRMYNGMVQTGLAAKTVKNTNTILSAALNKAVEQGLIPKNPCLTVTLPKVQQDEIKPLSDAEIQMFLSEIDGHPYENILATCLFAGLREGECLGLSWNQIDFEKKSITISQQLQKRKSKGSVYEIVPYTKGNRVRVITPPPIAFDYLKRERQKQAQNKLLAGSLWSNPNNLVFTNETGRNISKDTLYRRFKIVAARIGRPDARPHDLRHTCGTICIASGADVKSVQELLGHATASFTLNRYVHSSEKMRQDTAARMQDYYDSMGLNHR